MASELEEKFEQLKEEIEKETNPSVRKEIQKKRSQLKNSVKQIREDFIPRMAKYNGLNKVHIEFGIVALAHNILKVAGIRQLLSGEKQKNKKRTRRKTRVFSPRTLF